MARERGAYVCDEWISAEELLRLEESTSDWVPEI